MRKPFMLNVFDKTDFHRRLTAKKWAQVVDVLFISVCVKADNETNIKLLFLKMFET